MKKIEEYVKELHLGVVYLITLDKEKFYDKLGYSLQFSLSLCVCVFVCKCACVCVWERQREEEEDIFEFAVTERIRNYKDDFSIIVSCEIISMLRFTHILKSKFFINLC